MAILALVNLLNVFFKGGYFAMRGFHSDTLKLKLFKTEIN